jgi:hypothetical protein
VAIVKKTLVSDGETRTPQGSPCGAHPERRATALKTGRDGGRDMSIVAQLATLTAKELAAQSKGHAIASQAPKDCDEIDYSPGPPTRVFFKDRRSGRTRVFKFTFQWQLIEVGV